MAEMESVNIPAWTDETTVEEVEAFVHRPHCRQQASS